MQWRRGLAAVGAVLQICWMVPRGTLAGGLPAGDPAAATVAASPGGAAVAAWLTGALGPAAEWEVPAGLPAAEAEAVDLTAATEAALAAWLRRHFPAAGPLVLDALPGHLARRAIGASGPRGQGPMQSGLARDRATWERYAAAGLGEFALDPAPSGAPAAAWLSRARLYWHALEQELARMGGPDLWAGLRQAAAVAGAAAAGGPDAANAGSQGAAGAGLARQLAGPAAEFYDRHAAPGADGAPPAPFPLPPAEPDPAGPSPAPDPAGDPRAPGGIALRVAGRPLELDDPLIEQDGAVLAPLRALFGALGAAVEWDAGQRRAVAELDGRRVELTVGRRSATIAAGDTVRRLRLRVPPLVQDGRVYVPLRVAAEALGAAVDWDPATRTVSLTPGAGPDLPLPPPAPTAARTVYLTFDDGPDAALTPRVLDILWEWDVQATFFVVGEKAARQPELLRRMVAEGHAVGTHTWDHVYDHVYRSPAAFVDSLDRAAEVIGRATGAPVNLARAPGGTGTAALRERDDAGQFWAAAGAAGYTLYNWHIDSGDALPGPRLSAGQLAARVEAAARARGQGPLIVLFHDAATHEPTAAALPDLIAWFLEQGYEFAALPN